MIVKHPIVFVAAPAVIYFQTASNQSAQIANLAVCTSIVSGTKYAGKPQKIVIPMQLRWVGPVK